MDMARPTFRFPLIDLGAFLGVLFGGWLIQQTFQPASDLPNRPLLVLAALDLLLCFSILGYRLRRRLHAGDGLPRYWIVTGAFGLACFLGWISALLLDADRVANELKHHQEYDQQVAKLIETLRHFGDVIPANQPIADKNVWQVNHDRYVHLHDQLQTSLRANSAWDKNLTRVQEQVDAMHKKLYLLLGEPGFDQRVKWRSDFQGARELALQNAESLHGDIAKSGRDLANTHRVRWQSLGSAALTGVVLILGALMMWVIFDREIRRMWKRNARLALDEARYRALVEQQSDALAMLDAAGNIVYVNPAWKSAFGYEVDELVGRNLYELIHPDDRMRVQLNPVQTPIACRVSARFGIWHDVEILCQPPMADGTTIVRLRELRETVATPKPVTKTPEVDPRLQQQQDRIAELERETARLRDRESAAQRELQQHRWLLDSHQQANTEGVLILSAQGEMLSSNPAFARMWKLSTETIAGHSWQTIAAHMESLVETGWDDFRRTAMNSAPTDSCWEMTLEGGRTVEVYAQALRDHPTLAGAIQFHFRDVTKHKELETNLRDQSTRIQSWEKSVRENEDRKKSYETIVREHEKKVKHLEKQRAELEATLRDHQERLHSMHDSQSTSTKANKESMRRLASGVANEFNNVLSVVLGNTDILHENLPKDHMAQNYVDEIRQAASRGTEIAQRLLAFSRNHLLQPVPVEMNQLLESLESKIQQTLGHDVQLDWQPDKAERWVKTDPHPFEQALLHIVGQAKQHMPTGGTLTIRTERITLAKEDLTHADMTPGAYIQVRVCDTGAGLSEETIAHLFEPYHPINEGTKGDLSLATAYGIVRQNGGTIDVESSEGNGNTWTLALPETNERPQLLRASA